MYDVVVSLLRALNESHSPTLAGVERAAATLSPTRFRPDLTPTATKLYATLLHAEQPLGRTELIKMAEISASSYDRRIQAVRKLKRIHPVQVDGHRRWASEPEISLTQPAASTATPLVAHRHRTQPHCVVSSHANTSAPPRAVHAQTELFTPPDTMTQNTTLPVKLKQPDQHVTQPAHHTNGTRMSLVDTQPPTPPTTPPLHQKQGGDK